MALLGNTIITRVFLAKRAIALPLLRFSSLMPNVPVEPAGSSVYKDYVFLDSGNTIFSQTMLKVKSKNMRQKSNLILLEGRRLIQDALSAGVDLTAIFFSRKKDIETLSKLNPGVKLYRVPYKEIKVWSDLTTSPGILAVAQKPEIKCSSKSGLPVMVVCDQIREPGNLGSILRNSAAAGIGKVLLTAGCVDVWDPKVLRGGAGAHFKLSLTCNMSWEEIKKALCFNNASQIFLADNNISESDSEDSAIINSLPVVPYYSVDYRQLVHACVIVGGETEGVSRDAYLLARYFDGVRVNIPLSNNMESLNSAAAASVILFEIKRQWSLSME